MKKKVPVFYGYVGFVGVIFGILGMFYMIVDPDPSNNDIK